MSQPYTVTRHYGDWAQALAYAENATYRKAHTIATSTSDARWKGSESLPAFIATARAGAWSSAQDRSLVDAISAAVGSHVQIPTYQVTDDPAFAETFDVGALTMGDPDHWIAPVYTDAMTAGARVITIAASVSASAGVDHDAMIRRGALAVAIAEALELAGYPVELIATFGATARDTKADYRFEIKRAGQPLDRDRALIALAHPSTLRRVVFAMMESEPDDRIYRAQGATSMLGTPAPSDLVADIVIPEMKGSPRMFESDRAAIQWALAELARIGAVLEPAA